ncbi:YggS family pyridoxal phosphate-dependent enzyme [Porphyromonas circumdentaria]|uniref:YggS family pyridoxal phosphate-dependent enzyme n=1 Tax=Porphyromonas circumdentaria TaxID=29524 RepID=UPI0026DA758B|nr:YggS family pyridoxal phosphate-dependent enzyme [Porphyromonas circumdentaria]MDO4722217.1 YggS family pyridoxal phosphate-dependent enzyme [Porphyromonas circumdentaria]
MIQDRIHEVKALLPDDVTLVVVTKNHNVEEIWEAYNAGVRDFGENRVQELMSKVDKLPKDIRWHLIGSLQRNKVKYIAPFIHCVQSVDSLALYEEILRRAKLSNRSIDFLLEIHIAQENTKAGLPIEELEALIKTLLGREEDAPYMKLRGLMTMATNTDNREEIVSEFRKAKEIFDSLRGGIMAHHPEFDTLSMGMSDDWHLAVNEGSNMIRIGSYIMGARSY